MAYTAWSVVFGEQPTAAKWNQLGANDAGFKDGTNIDNNAILDRHILVNNLLTTKIYNPVKFSAYRNAALTTGTSGADIVYDTKVFDTGTNFNTSNGRFTAPADGFYAFFAGNIVAHNADLMYMNIKKNGTELKRFKEDPTVVSGNNTNSGAAFVKLLAGDYVTVGYNSNNNRSFVVGNEAYVWFNGFLVANT